jgi:hypothetical protein
MTAEEGTVEQAPPGVAGPGEGVELDRQLGLLRGDETVEKQVRDSVLRSMGQFVNELMRSIRYFESQLKRRSRVGRVVMFGYIGGLDGLAEYLAEQTGLEVTIVTGLPGVESALDAGDEQELKGREAVLVVPMGLAVEGVKKRRIDLNLIPRETVYRRKSFNALKFAVVVVVIIAAVLANLYIQRANEYDNFKKQEKELSDKIASIQHLYDRSQQFKQYISQVEGKLKGVVTLAAMQPPWPVIMDELGRIMRNAAYIDEMHWDANGASWEVHGFCVGTDEAQMLLVNFWHSDIFRMTECDNLDCKSEEKEEGKLGPSFGGRAAAGGFGFSSPEPEVPSSSRGEHGLIPGADPQGGKMPWNRPEPMYKMPEGGTAWRDIEWYFQGHQYMLPLYYEFTFKGTINPAVMASGKDLFGELSDLVSGAVATTPTGPGGGGVMPGIPAGGATQPGVTPSGGDDEDF